MMYRGIYVESVCKFVITVSSWPCQCQNCGAGAGEFIYLWYSHDFETYTLRHSTLDTRHLTP